MANLTITEGMVLALLGKGLVYEIEDCEMEYEIKVPLGIFGIGNDDKQENMDVHVNMKIGKMKFEIQKG